MSLTTYFVSGASRGLGAEFVRQLLARDSNRVIAAARNPDQSDELQQLKEQHKDRIMTVTLDVTDDKSVEEAVSSLKGSSFVSNGIDVLINNAGYAAGQPVAPTEAPMQDIRDSMETNLYGVIRTTLGLLPLLKQGEQKKIFTLGSIAGSIGTAQGPRVAGYSVSKAAVHMWLVKLARELEPEGFTVIPFHPGYVVTDMTGGKNSKADISKQESVQKSLENVIYKLGKSDTAKLASYDGKFLPW